VPRPDVQRVHAEIDGVVIDVRVPRRPPFPGPRPLRFTLDVGGPDGTNPNTITGRDLRMRLLDNQQVTITVSEVDAFGAPVPDENRGRLTAISSDESIVTVAPTEVGGEFLVTAVDGADGVSASVLLTDDVDADGTGDVQGSIAFDLVDHRRGRVAQLVAEAGEPESKPTA
jgi:hypothetical protein